MKIGIYAGTFDPIHVGHVSFAKAAVTEALLDKVVIIAEKSPYRKKPHASWDHRQAMIERATQVLRGVDHDYELASAMAHSHTMRDMLLTARKHYGDENQFWFLVGSDIFEHMKRWQDITQQHEYGGFVVSLRDDHTKEWLEDRIDELYDKNFPVIVKLVENQNPHISSSKIREEASVDHFSKNVPERVCQYIHLHNLYRS